MRDPSDPYMDERAARTPVPHIGPTRAELRQQAIDTCRLCDQDGYAGPTVCNHRPDSQQIAARGMAAVRAAMGWTDKTAHTSPTDTLPGT